MMIGMSRRWICLPLAITALSAVCLLQWRWLKTYRVFELPPRWDEAAYHTRAVRYFQAVESEGADGFWKLFTNPDEPRPPLLPISTLLLKHFGPYRVEFGHLVILGYLAVLAIGIYFLAEHVIDPLSGLFSMLYFLSFPITLVYSKEMLSDLPAAALVTVAMLCIVKSECYSRTVWNMGLGMAIGLAMTARNFAGVYLLFPLLYALIRGLRQQGAVILLKLMPGVLSAVVLAAPWYIHHLDAVGGFFSKYMYGDYATIHLEQQARDFFTPTGDQLAPFYYLRVFLFMAPSLFFGSLFLYLSAAWLLQVRRNSAVPPSGAHAAISPNKAADSNIVLLLLWSLGSFAILSSISNVSYNYVIPAMPPFAIAIEYLARKQGIAKAVRAFAAIAVVVLMYSYSTSAIGFEFADSLRQVYPGALRGEPIDPDWKIDQILAYIQKREGGKLVHLGVIGSHPFFSSNSFRLEIKSRRLPFSITEPLLGRDEDVRRCLIVSDYIVTKTGLHHPTSTAYSLDDLHRLFEYSYLRFEQLPVGFGLPDNSTAMIFRRVPDTSIVHTTETQPCSGTRIFKAAGAMIEGRTVNPVSVVYDDKIELHGLYLSQEDGFWYARYFWHLLDPQGMHVMAFVHFLDRNRKAAMDAGNPIQGDYPLGEGTDTTEWLRGDYITDGRLVRDLPGLSGTGFVGIGLDRTEGGGRLRISSSSVPTDDQDTRALVPLDFFRPRLLEELKETQGRELVSNEINFSDLIVLESCRLETGEGVRPEVRYVWRCIGKPLEDLRFFVHFTDHRGEIVFQDDHIPLEGQLPATGWRPGEWVVERRTLSPDPGIDLANLDVRIGISSVSDPSDHLTVLSELNEVDWNGHRAILRRKPF